MFSYDCMRILLMMLDCAVVHSTATWVSNSLKGHPLVCNLGLQSFKGTYLATVLQSWFIGVRFFKAEICPGSHSLRGYQWSLKDSGVRVGARIARGMSHIMSYFNSFYREHRFFYPNVRHMRVFHGFTCISSHRLNLVERGWLPSSWSKWYVS